MRSKVELRFFLGALFLLLAGGSTALANDVYIAQTALGSATGADCADALAVSYFNTSGNWTSTTASGTKIGPGTTVHLCGTFTASSANTSMLTVQASGASATQPITILFESGAILTSPAFSANGAINVNSKSYITINGDITNGHQGIIRNTANGTGLANSITSRGVACPNGNCTGLVVENLQILNVYVHSSVSDTSADQTNNNSVMCFPCDNLTINDVLTHDAGWAFNFNGNNDTLEYSEAYNIDHGVAFGPSGTVTGLVIHDNHIHDYSNWDTTSNAYHHDGIHYFAGLTAGGSAGDQVNGSYIYNNLFDGNPGTNVTAHIFLEEQVQNTIVFNNVFVISTSYAIPSIWFEGRSNSSDTYSSGHGVSNAAYNNFIQSGSGTTDGNVDIWSDYQDSLSVINNVTRYGKVQIYLNNSTIASSGIDYNYYNDAVTDVGASYNFSYSGESDTSSFSTWKTYLPSGSGQDAHSLFGTNSQQKYDSTGHPLAGSPGIGAGKNLTSLAITPLNSDRLGAARPSSGAWDIGAYVYGGTVLSPPTDLTATPH